MSLAFPPLDTGLRRYDEMEPHTNLGQVPRRSSGLTCQSYLPATTVGLPLDITSPPVFGEWKKRMFAKSMATTVVTDRIICHPVRQEFDLPSEGAKVAKKRMKVRRS